MSQPQLMWMFVLTPVAAGIVSLGGLLWIAVHEARPPGRAGLREPRPELELDQATAA